MKHSKIPLSQPILQGELVFLKRNEAKVFLCKGIRNLDGIIIDNLSQVIIPFSFVFKPFIPRGRINPIYIFITLKCMHRN